MRYTKITLRYEGKQCDGEFVILYFNDVDMKGRGSTCVHQIGHIRGLRKERYKGCRGCCREFQASAKV